MGEIIVRKVRGMNWKAKISLVLIFTLMFSTFMYEGWYKPTKAAAATATYDFSSGAGTNKWAYQENNALTAVPPANRTSVNTQLTGTNYTAIGSDNSTYYANTATFGDANAIRMDINIAEDPATIDSMVITFNGYGQNPGLTLNTYIWNYNTSSWQIFDNTMAIGTTDTNATATYNPTGNFANFVNAGQVTIVITDSTTANLDWWIDYVKLDVNYVSGDQVNVAGGTNPSDATVYANDANKAIDGFTMTATNTQDGQATVTAVTASLTNSGNISAIRLYKDNGVVGTYEPGTDTLLSTGTPGASVSFSGLSETITTAGSNYLIVGDIASGATVDQTVTAVVSGVTVTAPDSAGTIADSSATLKIGNPVCVRANPTVSITPLSAGVSAGYSTSYTVSVTNNDNQFCSSTTFIISKTDAPAVPNANFGASTLGSSSTGSLAYGQTWTTSLIHSSTSGAALGQTEQTYVTSAADANHAAVQSNTVTTTIVRNPLLHNSLTMTANGSPKNYWSANGGWGIAGGVYGEFTCETCHAKTTTNIKRVKTAITVPDTSKGNIPGSAVNLQSTAGTTNGFGDDQNTHATSTRVCEVCHSQVAKHKYNQAATPLHENTATTPANYQDCIACHEHKKGFALPGCIDCHSKQQGNRAPVVGQFSNNSHHIQGADLTNTQCYQCHWEANANGSINYTYHLGWQNGLAATSGAAVDLVVWGTSTTRPTTYTLNTTAVTFRENQGRTDMANINTHCLGCHNDANLNTQSFGDGKKTSQYAWDGNSIAARYSQTGTTTWGKYTTTTNAAQKNLTKAFSAHGNAANNARGWSATIGVDGAITNTSGGVNVLCFDCHNSHGSSVSGMTTSYTSATTNGAILKDTTAGLGAYAMTYQPQASDGSGSRVAANPGASLCFDCHMTANAGTTPWGYTGTYGATQAIIGYSEKPGWKGGSSNPAGAQQRYAYKNNVVSAGGHFGASSALGTTPMGTINGLCTPCHDPHGVSPTNVGTCSNTSYFTKVSCQGAGGTWTANATTEAYGVPLLKGTWMTSPYKEDAAPSATNERRGGSASGPNAYAGASTPGYHIDQNTFENIATSTGTTGNWNWPGTVKMSENDTQFGGLCLSCHNKANLNPNTTTTWKSYDRIHNTVKGWANGAASGANNNNAIHAYSCSKCHTPHNSCLPRLMVTNCIDYNHRGQVASGGTPGQQAPQQGSRGAGQGRFPAGGGGNVSSNATDRYTVPNGGIGAWFAGNGGLTTGRSTPALNECHNVSNAGGTTHPTSQLWNTKTPW